MQQDSAFLRLKSTFADAKQTRNPAIVEVQKEYPIQLLPDYFYLQITNSDEGIIVSDSDFTAELIDCSGATLIDITFKTGIFPFTNPENNTQQIAFELSFLETDYHSQVVYLKITDTATATSYYSNGFLLTADNANDTIRLDYWGFGYDFNMGFDWDTTELKQSINIRGRFVDVDDRQNSKEYDQLITGNVISSAVQIYPINSYLSEWLDIQGFRALNSALAQEVIYLNQERVTNKPFQKKDKMLGMSNFFKSEFSASVNEKEVFYPQLQILEAFDVIDRFPVPGRYTLEQFDSLGLYLGYLQFNKNIRSPLDESLTVKVYKNGLLMATLTTSVSAGQLYISPSDQLDVNFIDGMGADLITENGTYDFVILPGKIRSEQGEYFLGYAIGEWRVVIADGNYDSSYYDTNYYFTN